MIDGTCKGCGELTSTDELGAFGGYCMECFDSKLPERDARIVELEAENKRLKRLAPMCDKHAAQSGSRSGCMVCALERLTQALSKISYACCPPNAMGVSDFGISYAEEAVVAEVARLRESYETLLAACRAIAGHPHKFEPGYATPEDVLLAGKVLLSAVIAEAEKASVKP